MALIFSPLSEDVLDGPFEPNPRSAFIMVQLGPGKSRVESDMDASVEAVLKKKRFSPINATSISGNKDYLEKIIRIIQGCGFSVAIFSEFTPAPTLANIFFEVAICNLFGKPVLLVKSEGAKPPSDFVRTEWVSFDDGRPADFSNAFSKSVDQVVSLGNYYKKLGNLALDAEDGDLEVAFERYKQALLISGDKSNKKKIEEIQKRLQSTSPENSGLKASVNRFSKSVAEFLELLP